MDISDIMGLGGHTQRPDHPDFWRLSEIIMQMKADMSDNEGDHAEQERLWRKRVTDVGDFDSISYSAVQCAIQLCNIETGEDFLTLRFNPPLHAKFISCVQAFYDGFLMGAQFEKRGGHQEKS